MEIKIKKFSQLNSKELYKILKARIDIFVVEQKCAYSECDNKDQKSLHLYYEKQNKIAAYLRIIPTKGSFKKAVIGRVMVRQEFRQKGFAEKLIKKAISYLNNNFNTNLIKISAQEYVLALYKKIGFRVVSEKYFEDGIPHYKMKYCLKEK